MIKAFIVLSEVKSERAIRNSGSGNRKQIDAHLYYRKTFEL